MLLVMMDSNSLYNTLLNKAVQLLAQRNHTVLEIKQKLSQFCYKKYANNPDDITDLPSKIQAVVDYCIEQKWLNELSYIEQYVLMRSRKGYGKNRIVLELKQRGIDDGIAWELINQQDIDWIDIGIAQVSKKYRSMDKNSLQQKSKIFQYLSYKGFAQEDIRLIYDAW